MDVHCYTCKGQRATRMSQFSPSPSWASGLNSGLQLWQPMTTLCVPLLAFLQHLTRRHLRHSHMSGSLQRGQDGAAWMALCRGVEHMQPHFSTFQEHGLHLGGDQHPKLTSGSSQDLSQFTHPQSLLCLYGEELSSDPSGTFASLYSW